MGWGWGGAFAHETGFLTEGQFTSYPTNHGLVLHFARDPDTLFHVKLAQGMCMFMCYAGFS